MRYEHAKFMARVVSALGAALPTSPVVVGDAPIHMVSYADPADYPDLAKRGVNTLVVELQPDGTDWEAAYDAAIQSGVRLIPLIWGDGQTIWVWNESAKEWELNLVRYPESRGAAFLRFLKDNPRYLKQTFALYSFHEPLAQPDRTGPKRLQKFYQQIHEDEFPGDGLLVYGEDITMGWEGSDECLTGTLDYESHNVYPFCTSPGGWYRPFDVTANEYAAGTDDLDGVLRLEVAALDARLERYAGAKPTLTGRRPRPILLIQAFASKQEKELWNRMPSAKELATVAGHLIRERGDNVAGLSWYPFRNPSEDYTEVLATGRYDATGADRWAVIDGIAATLRGKMLRTK